MNALRAYHRELIDIYSFAIELHSALLIWHNWLNDMVSGSVGTTTGNTIFFGPGDPNDPTTRPDHARTIAYVLAASENDGDYDQKLRWAAIVRLYSAWEDRFRQQIADECDLEKNDVQGDTHGDLRKFRNAIVHAEGRLDQELSVLRYFSKGDPLQFSNDQIVDLFWKLTEELNTLGVRYYGTDPGLTLTVEPN